MKKSSISVIVIVFLFLSGYAQPRNHYYFFCINTTEHFDARWVVEQVDAILSSMKSGDKFTVYYTTGIDRSEVILEPLTIDNDYTFWKEKKEKLKMFEAEIIQCNANANMENIMDLFDKIYDFTRDGLHSPDYTIDVYWFGDDAHYSEFGKSLVLNAYTACSGNTTWNSLNLCNNSAAPLKTKDVQTLLNTKILKANNIYIR